MTTSSTEIIHSIGPYEHTGPYAEAELFDTTGTPRSFCAECEHAPCVADRYPGHCKRTPRMLAITGITREVDRLVDGHLPDWRNPVIRAMSVATINLGALAANDGWSGRYAYGVLVDLLTGLRSSVPKDES